MISKPTVVLFMGPAGPGRSSFINKLTGVEGGKAMLGAGPRTQDIKEITMKLRNNQEYVLVDTPGLNDPHRPGGDILQTIADWLEMKYREGILLTGVIYAHDITRQMDGILCESLDIFCCICGDKAAERVRLVSTMWDQVKDRSAAETMVSQLEGNSWKPLLDAGARHMQFNNSEKSAWNIVMDLGVGGQPLLLQQELVDAERNLYETFAGHALYLQLQKLLREELETPKPFWGVPRTRTVRRPMTELEIECRHIEAQLRKARKERQRLEMRHHSYLRQLLSLFSNPIIAIPEVSEIDLVIFVVGPPGADKSWNEAIQAGEIRHPCTKWHMSASRYNVKDSTNGILVVNTPSFHTDNDFYAERFMTSWLKSRFTKKCRSGVLFLHPLSKNPKDRDIVMQRHLDTFAMRFPNKSMVPSRVYVVPIGSSADAKLGPGQRLSELESVMKSSNSHCGRRWQVSVFPGVFEGQPEIAWSAALLLLKDIAETQANEMPSSRRLTLKGLPLKIPDNRAGLKNLADHLFEGYKKETTNSSLDAKIVLGRVVRDLTPASHPEYISTLIACADLLSERFGKEGRRADLDDAVTLRRNAWTSLPPHDPRWRGTLTELDDYLYKRFRRGSVADLEEIIYLRRTASECASLPDRCRSLVLLANALHERYRTLRVRSDLEEAIKLAHDVLAQNPSDHPDHVLAQKCLADCLQTKLGKGAVCAARAVTDASDPTDIHKVITNIISETVAKMPPRLLHTPTGALCNRDALISHFVNSPAYLELYSLSSPAQIRAKISLFFRFTTLSHRWGVREPLLRDIEGEVIYDLERTEGLAKLQQFCLVSLRHTFSWAWSDTCCIEKNSSAELQEAIGSMFSWYHRSSLTIVYLSDASDAGSLAGSIWFKRGWTLQELLASRTLLFYLQDWSPSMNSDSGNHKTDPTMLEVLQKATGVAARHLEDFSPGMDDPRSKLHWASSRCTTRPEDVAYCLFGIFKVHLPVIYGESAENALGRLLAEIVSQSGDISVLDWVGEASSFHSCFPANLIPYQTVPCTQSIRCDSTRRDSLNFEGARKLYNILAKLPRPRFFHRRLILSSIAYRVVAAKLLENSTSSPGYTYEIHVSHLMPLVVTLSVCLGEDPTTYILIRPWHPKWVGTQTGSEVDATWELLEQLEQPFNALLLMRLPHNEYKRIASNCAITACVQDLRSIADSEILGLEIV
ncbi:hypothetical protein F5J12DRAFT_324334 [Pisolithus orientalis]|uniref:uncharacterized protein n=1 Tax=Pisolithus orientalis TaxID=936130 RepID=UPI002225745B|nr:uncharacterized protein F5J12DRAFT_324334 [Pisolithus orientalis]KAI5998377.1 hypothetical protein F5J12DRAFT_324334 [Pisolithus orientalis]